MRGQQAAGNTVEKAGLANGNLYGIRIADIGIVSGRPNEDRANVLGNSTIGRHESIRFDFFNHGDVINSLGKACNPTGSSVVSGLQQIGNANQVVNFLRPEDMAWDAKSTNRACFVSTNAFVTNGNGRLFSMVFDDITNPLACGTVNMLAEGGGGNVQGSLAGGLSSATDATTFEMLDNICVTKNGYVLVQEYGGGNDRLGRLWLYDLYGDNTVEIGINDAAFFAPGAAAFHTTYEETSSIVFAEDTLRTGCFFST